MFFRKVSWSPCEVDYLKAHGSDPINQLSQYLGKSRNAIKNKQAELAGIVLPKDKNKRGKFGNKIGKRADLGMSMRSGWEANVYRYLKTLPDVALIEYEPTDFGFWQFGITQGTVSYTPDFRLVYKDGHIEWLEVKGNMLKQTDKVKIRRFKKFYPDEASKLKCIPPSQKSKTTAFFEKEKVPVFAFYNDLKKKYSKVIPLWE